MISEAAYAKKVMKALAQMPEVLFATRVESGSVSPGIPDVFFLCGGTPVWLELKKMDGKIRPSQKIWHGQYRKAGGYVFLARPQKERETIPGIKDYLRQLIKEQLDAD